MTGQGLNHDQLTEFIAQKWEAEALPSLQDFIRMECISPNYDPQWVENGKVLASYSAFREAFSIPDRI